MFTPHNVNRNVLTVELLFRSSASGMLHLADVVRSSGGGHVVGSGGHGGAFGERALPVWAHGRASLPWRRAEDNAPYYRYDCGDAKRGRWVCPHTAVNGRGVRSANGRRRKYCSSDKLNDKKCDELYSMKYNPATSIDLCDNIWYDYACQQPMEVIRYA